MTDHNHDDRRSFPRVKLSTRIDIMRDSESSFVLGRTGNICEGGVFIEGVDPWPPGTSFGFGLRPCRGMAPVRGSAEVVWVRHEASGPQRRAGMGVRFLKVHGDGLRMLRSVVVDDSSDEVGQNEAADLDPEATVPDGVASHAEDSAEDSADDVAITQELEIGPLLRDREKEHGRRPMARRLAAGAAVLVLAAVAAWIYVTWYDGSFTSVINRLKGNGPAAGESQAAQVTTFEEAADPGVATRLATHPMKVEQVSCSASTAESIVVIQGSGDFSRRQVSSERLDDPPRYVVQLFGMTEPFLEPSIEANGPGLAGIRVGQHADGPLLETRVVLDLNSPAAQVAEPDLYGNTIVLRISD